MGGGDEGEYLTIMAAWAGDKLPPSLRRCGESWLGGCLRPAAAHWGLFYSQCPLPLSLAHSFPCLPLTLTAERSHETGHPRTHSSHPTASHALLHVPSHVLYMLMTPDRPPVIKVLTLYLSWQIKNKLWATTRKCSHVVCIWVQWHLPRFMNTIDTHSDMMAPVANSKSHVACHSQDTSELKILYKVTFQGKVWSKNQFCSDTGFPFPRNVILYMPVFQNLKHFWGQAFQLKNIPCGSVKLYSYFVLFSSWQMTKRKI